MAALSSVHRESFDRPLDYLVADHQRQREICALLESLCERPQPLRADVETAATFLLQELPRHTADEEQELFVMMRRRCRPEDGIEELLARLDAPERGRLAKLILVELSNVLLGDGLRDRLSFAVCVSRFVTLLRLHVAYCNAILLPLARKRLRREDLVALGQAMRRRRRPAEPAPG